MSRSGKFCALRLMLDAAGWLIATGVVGRLLEVQVPAVEPPGASELHSAIQPGQLQFATPPRWVPSPAVPLAGSVEFVTTLPCQATVAVIGGGRAWEIPFGDVPATEHALTVLGLKPNQTYELHLTIEADGDSRTAAPLVVTTPPLPSNFPGLRAVTSHPERMEPGFTLFSVLRWESDVASLNEGWFIMVDAHGDVVWYLQLSEPAGAIRPLPNGNFLFLHGAQPTGLREIDPLGNVVRQYRATGTGIRPRPGELAVSCDTFHHDCLPLPDGNVLVLSTEVRQVAQYPVSETRPDQRGPANVVGDVVIELRPDGTIARRWPLLDILDPTRIGYGSLDDFWDLRAYPFVPGGTRDWSHANSVALHPDGDALVVCLRHQDAIVKFDRSTHEVHWILGAHDGWREPWSRKLLRPAPGLEFPFHAHGVKFSPEGTLLLFDNGNCRRLPPARPQPATSSYSRAVEYAIDEANRTARQVWQHRGRGRDRFFSAFVGDVDLLPQTGNVLMTDGGRLESRTGAPLGLPPGDVQWGRIVELTRSDPSEVVFELHVREPERNSPYGSSIYRAERLPPSWLVNHRDADYSAETTE